MAGLAGQEVNEAIEPNGAVTAAWNRVRDNLRASAGARLFDQWLKPIQVMPGDGDRHVRLGLPSAFMASWVRNHYADRIFYEFRAILPSIRKVSIETLPANVDLRPVEAPEKPVQTPVRTIANDQPAPMPATPRAEPAAMQPRDTQPFDSRLTFDRFLADDSNRVATNAAKALAEPGRPRFSPLYLHSATGLGKTHLMHAIGHAFLGAQPDATAIYMPAERFMYEFVQAVRARDTFAFKARLRGVDLLMIDDLQFIAGKESTQEEFFHTVNEFMGAGKRLVVAADRPPQQLDGIETRLMTRLGSGLVADIRPPELSLRQAILKAKLADMPGAAIPAEVLDLLSQRLCHSVREMEGALNRLVAYAQLTGQSVTMDFAVATLGEVLKGAQRRITIDEIQRAVSAHYHVRQIDLISARRAVSIARPRQIAMYLAKRLTTRSLPEIGRKFGNRDHSTVIHAVRRIEELRAVDQEIDSAVTVLMRQLEG
ncbi:chromosomal replication initiator protein DnaA [Sphingomonas sp. FW199]|uniref:chromosomal replication initiator protein DnaA n=1 Tax=Sphingomonas sp. FW199 TaxID=3400217 RepID=UPI003CF9E5F8